MSEFYNDDDTPLPRRVHRQLGHFKVPTNTSDIKHQVEEYDELCGPVTVSKIDSSEESDG